MGRILGNIRYYGYLIFIGPFVVDEVDDEEAHKMAEFVEKNPHLTGYNAIWCGYMPPGWPFM